MSFAGTISTSRCRFLLSRGTRLLQKCSQGHLQSYVYELDVDPTDVRLSPMLTWAQKSIDLAFAHDVRPTSDQRKAVRSQIRVHIINILLEFSKPFEGFPHLEDSCLKHLDRCKMPSGHHMKQYLLHISMIDKSSISGNIAVVNDVYINQLKINPDYLFDQAVPSINDQLTIAHIRGAKAMRIKDVNPFTRLQFLQLGFGLFHLSMNLIWALLHVHRGSVHQIGTLAYFFSVLDHTRLSGEHPDYHTLISMLFQILNGIILNAWRVESGCPSLTAFASSHPSADDLVRIADKIIQYHALIPHENPQSK
ncbi:hypothetical protein J3R83DRAFT_10518 [Lanmaoa asiatica]|nr:hypothetical protein J3R83DRAFT_10518 [Lanmaoa asiatica]